MSIYEFKTGLTFHIWHVRGSVRSYRGTIQAHAACEAGVYALNRFGVATYAVKSAKYGRAILYV